MHDGFRFNFESVGEILEYDHLNEIYRVALSCAVYCAVEDGFNFEACG